MDAPKIFKSFPKRNFSNQLLTDLSVRFSYVKDNLFNSALYYDYTIKDEERPDIVSQKIYDTTRYDWVILLTNNIYDVYTQWPKSNIELELFIKDKYGSLENAMSTIHHYEDGEGYEIDITTFNTIAGEKQIVTAYDYEIKLNDSKRDIKIVERSYINQIDIELRELLNEIT